MHKLEFTGTLPNARDNNHRNRQRREWHVTGHVRTLRSRSMLIVGAGAFGLFVLSQPFYRIDPQQIWIASSEITRTAETSVTIDGSISEALSAAGINSISLRVNGIDRLVAVQGNNFSSRVSLDRGGNLIQAFAHHVASNPIVIDADLPHYDIWIELTWQGKGDVDVHLLLPNGEECAFTNKRTTAGANLDFDNRVSDGPEHITMERAIRGMYQVKLVYYAYAGRDPQMPVNCQLTLKLRDGQTARTLNRTLYKEGDTELLDMFSF